MRTCACGTEYSVWKNLTISSDLADMGPGPSTVLMLHGFPDTADVFRNQVRSIQQPWPAAKAGGDGEGRREHDHDVQFCCALYCMFSHAC